MAINKRVVQAFLLMVCVGMVLSTLQIKEAKATTITVSRTFTSETDDGYLENGGVNDYSGPQSASSALTAYTTSNIIQIGQYRTGTLPEYYYYIERGLLYFDTSMIPDSATVTEVVLSLYVYANWSTTDFNVTVQNGQPTYPHQPMELGDYYRLHYRAYLDYEPWWTETDGGSRNTTEISALNYWNITLNNDGISWIDVDGTTKLCLRSNRDISPTSPTGNEFIRVYSFEQGSIYAPKLYVTYETDGCRYIVHGPYYENGNVANCISNVTLYSKTSNQTQFFLNGTDGVADTETLDVEQAGWYFQWNASATNSRSYYLKAPSFEEFWLYVADPTKTYATYTISFLDLAGVLKTMPHVKAERYINGIKIVERGTVDLEKKVIFYMEAYTSYSITIEDETVSYSFGDLIFGASTSITLTLKGVDFPKATLFTYKYVRIYADRTFGEPYGNVTITYQDTLNLTTSVQIWINYKNGTNIYTTTLYTNSFISTWTSALNSTDYALVCTITHQTYGTYSWRQYLPQTFSTAPWGMAWFGTLPFNSAILIPAFIIIGAGALFSVINIYMGAFTMTIIAAILTYMGWIPISATFLIVAFTFCIMMALTYAKRKIQT
jgi:hypothetical protein